jgi:hypothetical protein
MSIVKVLKDGGANAVRIEDNLELAGLKTFSLANTSTISFEAYGSTDISAANAGGFAMPRCAGVPTGAPAAGEGAFLWDSTNDNFYVWDGSAWNNPAAAAAGSVGIDTVLGVDNTVNGSTSLIFADTSTLQLLSTNSTLDVNGTALFDGTTTFGTNAPTFTAGAAFTTGGTLDLAAATTLDVNGTMNVDGTTTFGTNAPTFTAGAAFTTGGTLDVDVASDFSATSTFTGGIVVNTTALDVNAAATFDGGVTIATAALDVDSAADFSGGVNFNTTAVTINTGANVLTGNTFDINSGATLDVNGTMNVDGTTTFGTSAPTFTAGAAFTTGGTLDVDVAADFSATSTFTGGVVVNTTALDVNAAATFDGGVTIATAALDVDAAADFSGGVNFNTTALTINTGADVLTGNTFEIDQGATLNVLGSLDVADYAGTDTTAAVGTRVKLPETVPAGVTNEPTGAAPLGTGSVVFQDGVNATTGIRGLYVYSDYDSGSWINLSRSIAWIAQATTSVYNTNFLSIETNYDDMHHLLLSDVMCGEGYFNIGCKAGTASTLVADAVLSGSAPITDPTQSGLTEVVGSGEILTANQNSGNYTVVKLPVSFANFTGDKRIILRFAVSAVSGTQPIVYDCSLVFGDSATALTAITAATYYPA